MTAGARDQPRGRRVLAQAGSVGGRVGRAWRLLDSEQRLAAAAALALFVTMLLPWYTKTNTLVVRNVPRSTQSTFSAFGAFSFVEAAVLLVSGAVLTILFARAERRAFHLPGGDGTIIMLAGAWAAVLIFYRMLDKPSLHGNDVISATEGITWGIFVALLVALALAYAGRRMHVASRPEPPLPSGPREHGRQPARDPGEDDLSRTARDPVGAARAGGATSRGTASSAEREPDGPAQRPRRPPAPGDSPRRSGASRGVTREDAAQLSFEDPPDDEPYEGDPPPRRRR
jgi:hypothetical protein